jgi:membrane protein YdbS with pleckstrin-like domain
MIPESSNYCRFCGAPQHGPEAASFLFKSPSPDHFDAPSFMIQHAQDPDKPAAHVKHDKKEHAQADKEKDIIENQRLAGAARFVFFFSYIGRTIPILIGLLIGVWFDPLVFGILVAGYFFLLLLIAFAVHDSFRYSVDEHSFEKEFGIIHTQQVTIPFSHIENVNIVRTTADMLLGLARIDIETAGSAASTPRPVVGGSISKAEAHLPGVTLDQAKRIHDLVLQKMDKIKK